MNKFMVVTYYAHDDKDHGGDYRDVVLFLNGMPVVRFGDAYHDKGFETCEGYCKALIDMRHCAEVEYVERCLPKKFNDFYEGKLSRIEDVLK